MYSIEIHNNQPVILRDGVAVGLGDGAHLALAAQLRGDLCEWCNSTSAKIDSLEYQLEQINGLIAEWKSASRKCGTGVGNIIDHHVRELEAIVE